MLHTRSLIVKSYPLSTFRYRLLSKTCLKPCITSPSSANSCTFLHSAGKVGGPNQGKLIYAIKQFQNNHHFNCNWNHVGQTALPCKQSASRARLKGEKGRASFSTQSIQRGAFGGMEEALGLIQSIHKTQHKAVIYVTGGGLQAVTWLLTVPGASNTVLEARIPYASSCLHELLGEAAKEHASPETAKKLAQKAYNQAGQLSAFGTPILGVACTAALATDRIKKGDHKVCVATHDGKETRSFSIKLTKGQRDRSSEDSLASLILVRSLALVCGLKEQALQLKLGLNSNADGADEALGTNEELQEDSDTIGDPLEAFYKDRLAAVEFSGGQVITNAPRQNRIYLPGSYNPLHNGHREMLQAACSMNGSDEGCYELSIGNPDKGVMPIEECRKRIKQFTDADIPLLVTKAPLYSDKSKLCPGSTFVVGYDTAIRLVMPKYYGGFNSMILELNGIHLRGCRFLVAGRVSDDGSCFLTLDDVSLPEEVTSMSIFRSIPEDEFRQDISSTELRSKGQGL